MSFVEPGAPAELARRGPHPFRGGLRLRGRRGRPRARPGEPDRRAHRLQRRPLPAAGAAARDVRRGRPGREDGRVRIASRQASEPWEGSLDRLGPGDGLGLGDVRRGRAVGAARGRARRPRRRRLRRRDRPPRCGPVQLRRAGVLGRRGRRRPARAGRDTGGAARPGRRVHARRDRGRRRPHRRDGPDGLAAGARPAPPCSSTSTTTPRGRCRCRWPRRAWRSWSPTPGSPTRSSTAGTPPAARTARRRPRDSGCRRCARPTWPLSRRSTTSGSAAGPGTW